jgi:hypothetical protein
MCVQLQACYTRLDGGISVVLTDAENAVHFVQCNAERAFSCDNCTFNAGTGAIGDYRYTVFRANFDNFGNFGVGFRESDSIWERASVIGGIAGVCVSDSTICAEACSKQGTEFSMRVF